MYKEHLFDTSKQHLCEQRVFLLLRREFSHMTLFDANWIDSFVYELFAVLPREMLIGIKARMDFLSESLHLFADWFNNHQQPSEKEQREISRYFLFLILKEIHPEYFAKEGEKPVVYKIVAVGQDGRLHSAVCYDTPADTIYTPGVLLQKEHLFVFTHLKEAQEYFQKKHHPRFIRPFSFRLGYITFALYEAETTEVFLCPERILPFETNSNQISSQTLKRFWKKGESDIFLAEKQEGAFLCNDLLLTHLIEKQE